jgi:hypothetical protein
MHTNVILFYLFFLSSFAFLTFLPGILSLLIPSLKDAMKDGGEKGHFEY